MFNSTLSVYLFFFFHYRTFLIHLLYLRVVIEYFGSIYFIFFSMLKYITAFFVYRVIISPIFCLYSFRIFFLSIEHLVLINKCKYKSRREHFIINYYFSFNCTECCSIYFFFYILYILFKKICIQVFYLFINH